MKFAAFGVAGTPENARMVESLGYDGLFFGHHHSPYLREAVGLKSSAYMSAAAAAGQGRGAQWPLIAALAAQTKRLEFGTSIFLLPFAHPLQVAEEVASIDQISQGRIILGVGIGYNPADFQTFGIPMSNRVSLFDEGIEIIRRAWTEEKFTFVGKRYHLKNVTIRPRPFQDPHPPIWIGPWTLEGFLRGARLADGVVTDPMQSLAALKEFIAAYRELAVKRGKKPYVAVMRETLIGRNKEEALQNFGESIVDTMRYYSFANVLRPEYEPWLKSIKSPEQITFQMVNSDNRLLWGSPEEVVEQIHQMDEMLGGIDYVLPAFPRGRLDQGAEQQMEAVRLFGEKVAPHFR